MAHQEKPVRETVAEIFSAQKALELQDFVNALITRLAERLFCTKENAKIFYVLSMYG